ncbi:HrgA protein [Chromobacterium violaceum]|uniref:COG2958 family protein n=1 Tax=Chromobacterium TaxID=535 RepID=UPI0006532F14|nr:HrgA protein [Chromobacterium violaceum]KMN51581.1 HrgA protein [Chromobacterium violaceum]KMN86759.1 HrgA protein [Chromobacterium violaceum]KMN91811.1 HrgA protein [Chromobacterium violaceum]KMO05075.1 HrgA protein [Chromobacterium violaceum]
MSRLSQSQKVAQLLRSHPGQRFTARQIASAIVNQYPEDYADKRSNPRFANDKAFLSQVVAEIGAQKDAIIGADSQIRWQDKPRPRVYWYEATDAAAETVIEEDEDDSPMAEQADLSEHQLYPLLMQYLQTELSLYGLRVDEKRSRNQRGSGGNHWLHPDLVAMQPVAKDWHELVRSCVLHGGGQSVRLWAFEVKKELTRGNVRKYFFQAVSNSSWANEGYLVCTGIVGKDTEDELRMLSALHGIGVIVLDSSNPSESEIVVPARARQDVDWQSVHRLVEENEDMREFVELVSTYYQTGRLRPQDWNKC